jgi:hypothetical protein
MMQGQLVRMTALAGVMMILPETLFHDEMIS